MWHDILYYILLIVLLLFGLFINVLTLPGLWLMAAVYGVYGWLTWDRHYVGWPSLIAMAVLATIAEVVELTAGSAGAKKAGASKRAMIGAVVGGMIGAVFLTALIPIPVVGTIIGVCLGAALGAGTVELMVARDPLGPPIYWIVPKQATFQAERELTCASGLDGFCRVRIASFEQLGEDILADCGGGAIPQVTAAGRQMVLGHLLRTHADNLQ